MSRCDSGKNREKIQLCLKKQKQNDFELVAGSSEKLSK